MIDALCTFLRSRSLHAALKLRRLPSNKMTMLCICLTLNLERKGLHSSCVWHEEAWEFAFSLLNVRNVHL